MLSQQPHKQDLRSTSEDRGGGKGRRARKGLAWCELSLNNDCTLMAQQNDKAHYSRRACCSRHTSASPLRQTFKKYHIVGGWASKVNGLCSNLGMCQCVTVTITKRLDRFEPQLTTYVFGRKILVEFLNGRNCLSR